jgi:hypothetical protein
MLLRDTFTEGVHVRQIGMRHRITAHHQPVHTVPIRVGNLVESVSCEALENVEPHR